MRLRYVLPFLILAAMPACAAEKTKEIKLTTGDAMVLADVFRNGLSRYEKAITEGGKDRAVVVNYQFEIATRMAFARNLQALEYVTKAAEKARQDLVMDLSDGRGTFDPNVPAQVAASAKAQVSWMAALNQVTTFNLITITQDELKLKENPLPVPVMTALLPLMEEK